MTIQQLSNTLNLKPASGLQGLNNEITGCYVSDLLSDVMGHAAEGQIWITLQTHKNVMAIASLKDLSAIIIVKGLQPEDATIAQSNEEGIPILCTSDETFDIAGKIFNLLKG